MTLLRNLARLDQELSNRNTIIVAVLILCCIACFGLFYQMSGAKLVFEPDSAGYQTGSAIRDAGYVVFNKIILAQDLLPYQTYIQFITYTSAFCFLSFALIKLMQSFSFGILFFIACALNPYLLEYSYSVLSEAMFLPAFMLLCATLAFSQIKNNHFLWVGICAAILFVTKKVAVAFILAVLITMIFTPGRYKKLTQFGLSFISIIALFFLMQSKPHQQEKESYLGYNLIGKIAFVKAENLEQTYPATLSVFNDHMEVAQNVIEQAPSWATQYRLSILYYDYLRWEKGGELEAALIKDGYPPNGFGFKAFSLDIIANNLGGYLKDVNRNFWATWFVWDLVTENEISTLRNFILNRLYQDKNPNLKNIPGFYPDMIVYPIRAFLLLSMITSLFWAGLILVKWAKAEKLIPQDRFIGFVVLANWGYCLLIALIAAGIPRYALMVWPLHAIIVLTLPNYLRNRLNGI